MLENMTAAISRIAGIKARFQPAGTSGIVHVAPHATGGAPVASSLPTGSSSGSVKPFFPDYLIGPVKEKVKASAQEVTSYEDFIQSSADKYGVDPALVKAVIKAESGYRTNAQSHAGAQGLMQLMPSTAASLGCNDPFDPAQNIDAGTRYLKQQIDRFGSAEQALAAYNAGPGAVAKYNGVPPFRETQNYVNRVLSYMQDYSSE